MEIEIFKPLEYRRKSLDIAELNRLTAKKWIYASSGKAALFHCLNSLGVNGVILVPVYICNSILVPIREIGLTPCYYDVNKEDLNPSLADITSKINQYHPACVLVASMYGMPADLLEIEKLCRQNNILLIDDAAQAFGATTTKKQFAGTFGNAGFFSFSPGKPTSGHMGAFFWTENVAYSIKRTHNCLFHLLKYLDFYFNRYRIYRFKKLKIFKSLSILTSILNKFIDLKDDDICGFEKEILGGIIYANFNQKFRSLFFKMAESGLKPDPAYRLITNGEAGSNNHKIVMLFVSEDKLYDYKENLLNKGIFSLKGYALLSEAADTPNAKAIQNRVLEIPFEEDLNKMNYIIKTLNELNAISIP